MVSIIIPTYNRAKLIGKSIKSVLGQTYTDFELIIVDDCSTDDTKDVISQLKDERIKYIRLEKNHGACYARNIGIEHAKGDVIAFHDSDDEWHSDKLEKQLKCLKDNDADVVFCKMNAVDPDTHQKKTASCQFSEGYLSKNQSVLGISTQTILGKAKVFKEISFDPNVPRLQDFDLLMRIHEKYSIFCLDETLVDYNVGKDSISSNPLKLYQACSIFKEKYPDIKEKYPQTVYGLSWALIDASEKLKKGNKDLQKECVDLAFYFCKNFKIMIKFIMLKIHIFYIYKFLFRR